MSIDHATPAVLLLQRPRPAELLRHRQADCAKADFDFFGGGGIKRPEGKKGDQAGPVPDLARENGFKTVFMRRPVQGPASPASGFMAFNAWLQDSTTRRCPTPSTGPRGRHLPGRVHQAGHSAAGQPQGLFPDGRGRQDRLGLPRQRRRRRPSTTPSPLTGHRLGEALKFYEKHPSETLIVVTGDHECGGMTIGFAGTKYASFFDKLRHQKISLPGLSRLG